MRAFSELDEPRSTQQRIVWKFLSGIRDSAIRSEVIRQKWMKSPHEAKSFDEVLLIAEQAKLDRLAAVATGKQGGGQLRDFKAAPAVRVTERRKGAANRSPQHSGESSLTLSSSSGRSSRESRRSSTDSALSPNESDRGNFLCHYCKTRSHFGGWKV